jgi:CheY-like chemotaxis protein
MKRILYLDLNRNNFLLMQVVLKNMPIDIELTHKEEDKEIGQILKQNKFDLIISDTFSIRGQLIMKNLRAGNFGKINCSTPAIAYTAIYCDNEEEKCKKAGFNEYA